LPPLAGALPEGALKMARQVRLVEEAGCQRDLGQGPAVALRGDQLPGVAQPALDQVLVGRAAHRRTKHFHKMVGAKAGARGVPRDRRRSEASLLKNPNQYPSERI
jgi:hypothetical protein